MLLSGSRVFVLTRDQIIASALRKIGVVAQGESPTQVQYTEGNEALNSMVQAWQMKGVFLWSNSPAQIELQSGVEVYLLTDGDDTLEIYNPTVTSGAFKSLIKIIPFDEYQTKYYNKPTGVPVEMAVVNTTQNVYIHISPIPNADMTLSFTAIKRLQDFISPSDNPDFPVQWTEALIHGLAYKLSFEYGIDLRERQLLKVESEDLFKAALAGSRQSGGIQFSPRRS